MLRLFRSISRGRGRRDDQHADAASPFTGSPDISRHRAVGQLVDVDDDDVDDDDDESLSPRRRPNSGPSYFDRSHRYRDYNQEEEQDEGEDEDGDDDDDDDDDDDGIEHEDAEQTPLLPMFSSAHLDRLPLYNITHSIRLVVVQKCETTLSWDQLRSPQISQFLVKPLQSQIRSNHFNRATLCALIANSLQFQKEGHMNPGNVGVSKTRAWICELLAIRLLREFSTHELVDALSYDFDPLQGMTIPSPPGLAAGRRTGSDMPVPRPQNNSARVSTIEIAIRAEAKRFLAHPLVVQHLEAIWSGNIVFHSAADNLHRRNERQRHERRGRPTYGTADHSPSALPADAVLSRKARATRGNKKPPVDKPHARRSVTLYDPRDASLFKLSRLRVPRYRQVFSTLSFATMLGLFVAVLYDRSLHISPLEVLFWFWSAGYMLDEVVGFSEQGFGLYILSVWNAFDLGILCLFAIYYCLRLYGIVLAESGRRQIAGVAYDVLASTAILLFPRLFSVLDHYRYFSQLLIAFRMMAQDLIAILILILISCSGFFVAFTLSFADDDTDGNAVAYALFQIVMGFTPAAWDVWAGYNILGKAIMAMFLIICHFLIVTILITVLTNSFMAIVKNAEEEHQFLFAVNTISMVKSDALFSYVAPTNIIGWVLSPLRFIIPLRQFVQVNRTTIKITHFPVLFVIFSYERVIMARGVYTPTELVENQPVSRAKPVAFSMNKAPELFSPNRLREPSVISFTKDRALEEVFRRPFQGSTMRTTTRDMDGERRNSTNAVDKWMQLAENEGGASPPLEQPRSVVERLEHKRPGFKRASTAIERSRVNKTRDISTASKSMVSDADLRSSIRLRPQRIEEESEDPDASADTLPPETDADDETGTDLHGPALGESAVSIREPENRTPAEDSESEDYFHTPVAGKSPMMPLSFAAKSRLRTPPDFTPGPSPRPLPNRHQRNTSNATMLFAPQAAHDPAAASARPTRPPVAKNNTTGPGTATPTLSQLLNAPRHPKAKAAVPPRARPILPPRQKTAPGMTGMGLNFMDIPRHDRRQPSFNARALDLASEIGDNKWGPSGGGLDAGGISGMPASFSEQLMHERERELQRRAEEDRRRRSEDEEKGMVNRIMLARMHTLEEGFREVLKEIKDMTSASRRESEVDSTGPVSARERARLQQFDAAAAATSASGSVPRTVVLGRVGGGRERKSPRKPLVRRNTGGKKERPSRAREDGSPPPSPEPTELEAGARGVTSEAVDVLPIGAGDGHDRETGSASGTRPMTAFRDGSVADAEKKQEEE